jgi:hypothetical protein
MVQSLGTSTEVEALKDTQSKLIDDLNTLTRELEDNFEKLEKANQDIAVNLENLDKDNLRRDEELKKVEGDNVAVLK